MINCSNGECSGCVHQPICNKTDVLDETKKELANLMAKIETKTGLSIDWLGVGVTCKYYISCKLPIMR